MGDREEVSQEQEEAARLEERASRIRLAVLGDSKFMAGVRQSQQEDEAGEAGRPWLDVKRDLDIV